MYLSTAYSRQFISEKYIFCFLLICLFLIFPPFIFAEEAIGFLGEKVKKDSIWRGNKIISSSICILIMAGHSDSQQINGADGTVGESVGLFGMDPMDSEMTDELFWNLQVRDAVVRIGKEKGLIIDSFDPGIRTIVDPNDPQTNWSVGSNFAKLGVYVLEIHFDAYGHNGLGSGLIPPLSKSINNIDESLAQSFGRYPLFFRGGLGAPRRNIRILEIGKLEGALEKNLRDLKSRQKTIDQIAHKIVQAIFEGIENKFIVNPKLQADDIFLPDFYQ